MKACACSLMSMVYVNDIAVLVIAANAIIVGGSPSWLCIFTLLLLRSWHMLSLTMTDEPFEATVDR